MKLSVDFSPDLVALLEQEIRAGEHAVTAAMKTAGAELKQDWREQIARADLGHRLPRTIRNRTYPTSGDSIDAAAFIWSNAPEIINAHDRGARLTPAEWERRRGMRLRFIYRRNGPSLLVAEKARINTRGLAVTSRAKTGRGQVSAPIFLLVPQVKLRKRLDLARDAGKVARAVPGLIVEKWLEGG